MSSHLEAEGEKISKSTEEGLKIGVKKQSGTGQKFEMGEKRKGKVRSTNKSHHASHKPGVILPPVVKYCALPPTVPPLCPRILSIPQGFR